MTYLWNKENLNFAVSADCLNTSFFLNLLFQYDIFNKYQTLMLITVRSSYLTRTKELRTLVKLIVYQLLIIIIIKI